MQPSKATTVQCVQSYYRELAAILTKFDLVDRPERIYNVDEKGLSTRHKPPSVVTSGYVKPQAVTSGTRTLTTVIGCGNALGHCVPPFFVFPGVRMRSELLEGKSPGANVTCTESGWSNSEVCKTYLEDHLLKYLPERSPSSPVIVLYDGHQSHTNLGIIDWAKSQNIILFILPAHTSHVLQPLDVGCFGPFERIYNSECHKFMRDNCGQGITRYNTCSLGCSAYLKALTPGNLQSSFRKAGIYPLNPDIVHPSNFKPSEALQQETPETHNSTTILFLLPATLNSFARRSQPYLWKKPATKKRPCLSAVVSGKAITEPEVQAKIVEHQHASVKKTKEPTAGPSRLQTPPMPVVLPDSDSDVETDDVPCCMCACMAPEKLQHNTPLVFVKWVQCSKCSHWAHVGFCTLTRVFRRGDVYVCPHCTDEE